NHRRRKDRRVRQAWHRTTARRPQLVAVFRPQPGHLTMQDRRFLHLGRMLLAVPADAELVEFSATTGGVDLEELELGDSSPEAGYLAWMQVSEQAREVSGFDEVTVDERFWFAFYGVSEPRVIALAQCEDSGLLLSASATEWE